MLTHKCKFFSAPVIRLHPYGYSEVTLFTHIYNCFFSTCYPFAPFRIFRSYAVHSYIQLFFQHLLSVCTLSDIQKLLCSLIYTTVFSAPVIRLYPYGYSEGDSYINFGSKCKRIDIPRGGMRFFQKRHRKFHVRKNY